MDFFSSNSALSVESLSTTEQGTLRSSGAEAMLSNGLTIVVSVFTMGGKQFGSFGAYDKRLMPESPEPFAFWSLPTHLGMLSAMDAVPLAQEEHFKEVTAALNRICLSTKRPWVNIQEVTSLLVGTANYS